MTKLSLFILAICVSSTLFSQNPRILKTEWSSFQKRENLKSVFQFSNYHDSNVYAIEGRYQKSYYWNYSFKNKKFEKYEIENEYEARLTTIIKSASKTFGVFTKNNYKKDEVVFYSAVLENNVFLNFKEITTVPSHLKPYYFEKQFSIVSSEQGNYVAITFVDEVKKGKFRYNIIGLDSNMDFLWHKVEEVGSNKYGPRTKAVSVNNNGYVFACVYFNGENTIWKISKETIQKEKVVIEIPENHKALRGETIQLPSSDDEKYTYGINLTLTKEGRKALKKGQKIECQGYIICHGSMENNRQNVTVLKPEHISKEDCEGCCLYWYVLKKIHTFENGNIAVVLEQNLSASINRTTMTSEFNHRTGSYQERFSQGSMQNIYTTNNILVVMLDSEENPIKNTTIEKKCKSPIYEATSFTFGLYQNYMIFAYNLSSKKSTQAKLALVDENGNLSTHNLIPENDKDKLFLPGLSFIKENKLVSYAVEKKALKRKMIVDEFAIGLTKIEIKP